MKTTILLLSIFPFTLFAQEFEKEKDFHFGMMGQISVSSFQKNGMETTLFAEYKKHQVGIGARPFFIKSYDNYSIIDSSSNSSIVYLLNLHYRYFIFDKANRFNTFIQISSEIYKSENKGNYYYNSINNYPIGPAFNYSFNALMESKSSFVNLYLSIGEEVKLYKGFFVTANFGLGKLIEKSTYTIKDVDKDELVYKIGTNDKFEVQRKLAYTLSLGVGYRF